MKRSVTELHAMQKRGEIKSDWKAAAKKALPSGHDPDDAMEEINWLTTELPKPQRKGHMTLRIDSDVLAWFRAQGKGYQSRINAILRAAMEHEKKAG